MKAMEEFECLKVSPLNCVYDDLHTKKELEQDIRGWMEEKFKKLEAQIKEIRDQKPAIGSQTGSLSSAFVTL